VTAKRSKGALAAGPIQRVGQPTSHPARQAASATRGTQSAIPWRQFLDALVSSTISIPARPGSLEPGRNSDLQGTGCGHGETKVYTRVQAWGCSTDRRKRAVSARKPLHNAKRRHSTIGYNEPHAVRTAGRISGCHANRVQAGTRHPSPKSSHSFR